MAAFVRRHPVGLARAGTLTAVMAILCLSLSRSANTNHQLVLIPFMDMQVTAPTLQFAWWLFIELGGNIALYIPLGVFLPQAVPWLHSAKRTIVLGGVLSIAMETSQYFLPIGRVASTTDVMMNTMGAACGYLLAVNVQTYRGTIEACAAIVIAE